MTVVSDHQALLHWWKEHVDTPSGPAGRRGRWHETLSKFDLELQWKPGASNVAADALSRWAYPACKALNDCSLHGSAEDASRVKKMEEEEEKENWEEELPVENVRAIETESLMTLDKAKESVFFDDWPKAYRSSPSWKSIWAQCHQPAAPWPKGVQLRGPERQFMYLEGRLCVPEPLALKLTFQWHDTLGHCGVKKMVQDMKVRFEVANLEELVGKVKKGCQACQAAEKPNWTGPGQWRSTPVPDHPMMDVAVDLVHMGEEKNWEGKVVDSCFVVVDRHSGWVEACPVNKKGFTAKQAALLLHNRWFCSFGVPRSICSDLGPQFKATWWRTLCALSGVLHAQAVSYHSRSNGRAERAIGQLLDKLRKLRQVKKVGWCEALPRALQVLHDLPGPTGVSPYACLFGRDRTMGLLPLPESTWCEDSVSFVARMQMVDQEMKSTLSELHKKLEKEEEKTVQYVTGQKVWVLRPRPVGADKFESWWSGPCQVLRQVGEHSYEVQVSPSDTRVCHVNQLKVHFEDALGKAWPLYYTRDTQVDDGAVGVDDYNVEKIVSHRVDAFGEIEFLVKWEGYPPENNTWQRPKDFLPQYCRPWAEYCRKKNITVDIVRACTESGSRHSPDPGEGGGTVEDASTQELQKKSSSGSR